MDKRGKEASELHNFRIDFAMNRGHEMTIDRENGIYRNELDELEMNMLRSQRIPYLLPVDWFELDGKLTFRYRLTGLKMLLHRLQQQPLTMEQYYSLLLGITDALLECKDYMLRPEGCFLNEQFIFIGEQLHDVKLAYIPMIRVEGNHALSGADLLPLFARWISYVEHIDGSNLKRILQHFNSKSWPLVELRETLLDLIGSTAAAAEEGGRAIRSAAPSLPKRSEAVAEPPGPASLSHEGELKQQPYSYLRDHETVTEDVPYIEDEVDLEQSGRRKWIASAALFLAAAGAWRFLYFAAPSRQSLLTSAGITMLLLAAALYIWRQRAGNLIESVESQFATGLFDPHSGSLSKRGIWNQPPLNAEAVADSEEEAGHASSKSTLKHSPVIEPTTLLSRDKEALQTVKKPAVWLRREMEGQEERIELKAGSFRIGRAGEQVSYAESAHGVSRIHLEIEQINDHYYVKDLGSSNGSLLNGELMIPYKSYKLEVGNIIQLAGERGPCYELKAG